MKEASIRDAKSHLTKLVRETERGQSVRLTRRGKPVAVLVSDQEYERLSSAHAPRQDFLQFLQGWRREMIAKSIPFFTEADAAITRDRSTGRAFSFDK